jgi:predicted SAM-dependent methyltransferase
MKLHLGCGEKYLEGYINIDFPSSEHSTQTNNIADKFANILELSYPAGSVTEIRLHHVFEHFTRPIACALIANWYSWLKPGGILHIEVPDLYRTGKIIFNPFRSFKKKMVAIRHLFGSHEADWGVHCEGYTPRSLKKMLAAYGFKINKVKKNSWLGTYNFEIIAEKYNSNLNNKELKLFTEQYLKNFLISDENEQKMLKVWLKIYDDQLKKTITKV